MLSNSFGNFFSLHKVTAGATSVIMTSWSFHE